MDLFDVFGCEHWGLNPLVTCWSQLNLIACRIVPVLMRNSFLELFRRLGIHFKNKTTNKGMEMEQVHGLHILKANQQTRKDVIHYYKRVRLYHHCHRVQ